MGVWITGDIHGVPVRLSTDNFPEQREFSNNKNENVVIVCGDFGLVWSQQGNGEESYWLDWLEKKPFTTVFVDGNHENHTRLAMYPVREWNGGKVHEVRPHVLHLMRGEVFTIENKTFFAFGGASSHDVQDGILDYEDKDWRRKAKELERQGKYLYRVKGLSWWEEELPSEEEMDRGLANLAKVNNRVDYVVTHSPSTAELVAMDATQLVSPDVLTEYLDCVKATADYKKHYFGHMHVDSEVGAKDVCLYEQIRRIV